jgi:hypothetical protein
MALRRNGVTAKIVLQSCGLAVLQFFHQNSTFNPDFLKL